jgi:transposase
MNKLSTEDRKRVVAALVEGNSLRAVTRMTGVHRTTILKLLLDRRSKSPVGIRVHPMRREERFILRFELGFE